MREETTQKGGRTRKGGGWRKEVLREAVVYPRGRPLYMAGAGTAEADGVGGSMTGEQQDEIRRESRSWPAPMYRGCRQVHRATSALVHYTHSDGASSDASPTLP